MAIWISWNIDIPRSLNSHDSFSRRKFENRAPTRCRLGPILSLPTISFEFHVKVAEDIVNCRKFKCYMSLTMTLDRIKVTSTYTVHIGLLVCPTMLTVASHTTEIWPFECREISTFGEVWTLVIQKSGSEKLYPRSHTIIISHEFWAPRQSGGGDRPRIVQFSQLRKVRDLDLDLRSGRGHAGAHMWWRSIHTPN